MATFSFLISDTVNFPDPIINDYDILDLGKLISIYGNVNFEFTLTFTGVDMDGNAITINNISAINIPDFVISSVLSPNSIRIIRDTSKQVFIGEYYDFVSFDNTPEGEIVRLNPEDATPNLSIKEWNPPPITIFDDYYNFAITYTTISIFTPITENFNITQTFYWNYIISLSAFQTLVDGSKY